MIIGFLVGVIVGFVISENWLTILAWIEKTSQDIINRKKKNSK